MILYIPNGIKLLFFIYFSKNLITNMDVIKADTVPNINDKASLSANTNPNLNSLRKLAPNITGTDIKNVNSVLFSLDIPSKRAVIIVIPDLDVPGNIAAITCAKPIINADL